VDDAQWLDRLSAQVLAFAARRLGAESVALLFTVRETPPELHGFPSLTLEGLQPEHAAALLDSTVGSVLDPQVRERIIAETRGNPLALLALPRGTWAHSLAGGYATPDGNALTGQIEESFRTEVSRLDDASQRLLVLAAAEPTGDPLVLRRAAATLDLEIPPHPWAALAHLIEFAPRVRFRHPLIRSAVYSTADPAERQAAHRALSKSTAAGDPDRRAWHLAQSVEVPDELIAAELERSADRARARGGSAAAGAFLTRASELSPDRAMRAQRALNAAETHFLSGDSPAALRLLATAEAGPLTDHERARVDLLKGQMTFYGERSPKAAGLLLAAARRLEPYDVGVARETYLEALLAAAYAGPGQRGVTAPDLAAAARRATAPSGTPRPIDLLLDGWATWLADGPASGTGAIGRAAQALLEESEPSRESRRWMWAGVAACMEAWDDERFPALAERQVELARGSGALILLGSMALLQLAAARILCGRLREAQTLLEEALRTCELTGSRKPYYAMLVLAGWRGQRTEIDQLQPEVINQTRLFGEDASLGMMEFGKALLHNGAGEYQLALTAAKAATQRAPYLYRSLVLMELLEAAVRTEHYRCAQDALTLINRWTQASPSTWARGVGACARALLADGNDADALYRTAIEALGSGNCTPYLGRARLLYGEWLRREGRRVEARQQLRAAHDLLVSIDLLGFAARAARELEATSETSRKRRAEARDELTPQERQIAELAAFGLSNREIGEKLFLSHRTVSSHLYRVFPKLRVTSRAQLGTALAGERPRVAAQPGAVLEAALPQTPSLRR
jgi:DNA-binding CsgD family transcriptional regulator